MKINSRNSICISLLIALVASLTLLSTRMRADTGTCGGASITLPFTDVPNTNIFFCSIAEAFFSGLSNGTTSTTYSPSANVPREQMAAFVTRTLDQSLKRGSRRAALNQYWAPPSVDGLALTALPSAFPEAVRSDGADLWVGSGEGRVYRVRASDGKLLETWTGMSGGTRGLVAAKGKIYVGAYNGSGFLFQIDPTQPAGGATFLTNLGGLSEDLTFDGVRVWVTISGSPGAVNIVTLNPISVTSVSTGFTLPWGILYDGANIWVTDNTLQKLFKLDSNGAIIQTVNVDFGPKFPVFDGTNIWVPNSGSGTVTVVRASTGAVVATLTGNGLDAPTAAAFDGERILVTNQSGNSVSLWKAADLTPLGSVGTGASTNPTRACSDGLNFWITMGTGVTGGKLARF